MLLSLFSALYEALIGPSEDYDEFRSHLFNDIGLFTLVTSIVITALFYLVFGRWKSIWYTRVHWAITIFLSGLTGFLLAYWLTKSELGIADRYVVRFALMNALVGAVYFILFSFLLKPFSIYAKRTPL